MTAPARASLSRRPAAATREPLVELTGVARRYRMGASTVTALEKVDLTVDPGEFTVVLGPSGSGKTTLLNMIGALDSPTEGSVRIASRDIAGASRRELFEFRRHTVSFIFQTFNLFPALTAAENVEFGADVSGWRAGPGGVWGGEQQRVAIARALATRNPILLADEPTGELDFRTGVQILELLHDQSHEQETAVLVVTHNREIARVAHRVIELSSGSVISDAPVAGGPAHISELHW